MAPILLRLSCYMLLVSYIPRIHENKKNPHLNTAISESRQERIKKRRRTKKNRSDDTWKRENANEYLGIKPWNLLCILALFARDFSMPFKQKGNTACDFIHHIHIHIQSLLVCSSPAISASNGRREEKCDRNQAKSRRAIISIKLEQSGKLERSSQSISFVLSSSPLLRILDR